MNPTDEASVPQVYAPQIIFGDYPLHPDAEQQMTEPLVGVDLEDTRAVWVREGTKWMRLCDVPEDCAHRGSACLVNDDIVVVCFDVIFTFSISTKQWKRLNSMPAPRYESSI